MIILIIARGFEKFRDSKIVKGCMSGLKPAVVGMIGASAISVAKTVFMANGLKMDVSLFVSLFIFALACFLSMKKKTHPIIIIILSACLGILAGTLL